MTSPGSPNYDLGTAHGRIKLDVDDRGAKTADRALNEFARTIRKLEKQFTTFNASLNKIEREIKNLGRDFNRTERDAKKFEQATDDVDGAQISASRSTSSWRIQLRSLSATLVGSADLIRRTAQHARSFGEAMNFTGVQIGHGRREVDLLNARLQTIMRRLITAGNIANDFGGKIANAFSLWSRWGNNSNGFSGFLKSFRGLPIAGVGVGMLAGKMVGLNKAMKEIPNWQKNIVKVVGAFQGMALAAKIADVSVNTLLRKTLRGMGKLFGSDTLRNFDRQFHPIKKVTEALKEYASHITRAIAPGNKLGEQIIRLNRGMGNLGSGALKAIAGLAVMKSGLAGLAKQFPLLTSLIKSLTPSMLVAIKLFDVLTRAGIEALAKSLVWLSNIIGGLGNAIKQLSGGFLILPGLIGTIAISVGVLSTAFAGLKSIFEDVFKNMDDPEKFAEAMAKVPPQFRSLADVLVKTVKSLKGLREEITTTFSQGLDKDVEALSAQLMGPLRHGALTVAQSFVDTRSKLMQLLTSQQSVQDLGLAFQHTSGTIRNLNKAIIPVGNGLRDIAVVGMQFIRQMTGGAEGLVKRFEEWARVNRENGNLMKWMENAVRGAKDLARGLVDLSKGLWTILTMFSDRSGDDVLAQFADSMERFNKSVKESAATGFIKSFGDAVRNLGTEHLKKAVEIGKNLYETYQEISPVLNEISNAFSDIFIPAIKLASEIIEQFFSAFGSLGLTKYIGWILGLAASFKLLVAVGKPLVNMARIIGGLGAALSGFKSLASGAVDMLYYFGGAGQKAHGALTKVGSAISGMLGPLAAAAAAIAFLYTGFSARRQTIDDFNKSLAESEQHLVDFKDSLRNAFNADNGIAGDSVFSEVTTQMGTMLNDLKSQADQVPDLLDNVTELWFGGGGQGDSLRSGWGPFSTAQGNEFNAMQKASQDAERARKKFDELGLTTKDLAAIVTSSESAFKAYSDSLRASGENGNEAADALQRQRDAFKSIQREYATASKGSVALVNAINDIGKAGDDTASKLTALNNALKALGFNKADQYEAAFAFSEAIRKLGDEAATAVDKSQPLDGIFGPNGVLATSGPAAANAQNLYNVLRDGVDAFKQQAAAGGDIQAAWAELQNSLPKTAEAFQVSVQDIQGVITNLTGNDYIVTLLLATQGEDKVKAQIAAILAQYATGGPGAEIKIPVLPDVNPDEVQKAIDAAFGAGKGAVGNGFITIAGANISPEGIANLQKQIPGLQLPGAPPAKPAPIAVDPQPKPGPKPAYQPPQPAGETKAPQVAPAPADKAALDAANQTIADLKQQIEEINAGKLKIQVDTENLDGIKAKIDEIKSALGGDKLEFTIIAKGYDETIAVLNRVKDSVTQLIEEVKKIETTFGTVLTNVVNKLNSVNLHASGLKMMNDLAAGIREGIDSAVIPAVNSVMQAIKDRTPSSPPKRGPLSGTNYVDRSGKVLAEDFAGGIVAGTPSAVGAAEAMAGGVGNAVRGPYDIGKFLGRLQQLVAFGEHLTDVIGQVADTVISAIKYISDPTGSGRIFGNHVGFRRDPNVSDRDLARQREDDLQSKLSSAVSSGARDGIRAGIEDLPGMAGLAGIENPSAEEIAAAVVGEGLKTGESREATLAKIPQELAKYGESLSASAGSVYDEIVGDLQRSSSGRRGGAPISGYTSDDDLLSYVPRGSYSQSGNADLTQGLADCSSAVEDLVNIMDGRPTGSRSMNTGNAAQWLLDRGFIEGAGGPGDMRVAFNATHMQATLPGGTPFNWGSQSAAQKGGRTSLGADDPSLNRRYYRPSDISGTGRYPGPDLSELTPNELEMLNSTSGLSLKTQEQMLAELRRENGALDEAIRIGEDPNASDAQVISSLNEIQRSIDASSAVDTATGRQQTQGLESIKSSIMGSRGMTEGVNPIDTAASIASGATSIAKDIFGVINSSLDAINGANNIANTLVRGIENSEDIYNMVDEIQKFIDLAARVAGAVSSVSGTIGGIVSAAGGADPSGGASGAASALQGVSAISGLISGALDTVNGIIDLAQEAYRIFGTYFGEFLGYLAGAGSQLEGDVKFLLDENDKTLKAYSTDNPLDKREHALPFSERTEAQQAFGDINVFPERGADPAELTRTMMFAVRTAGMGSSNQQ